MPEIGACEARVKFAELLRRVEKGERFVITRHGLSCDPGDLFPRCHNVRETIQALRKMRKGQKLQGLNIRELIEEGRM